MTKDKTTKPTKKYNQIRCVNIDWFECYCIEPNGIALDAQFYRNHGYKVEEREYGTRHFEEVFTIYDKYADPFMEVRRKPRGKDKPHAVYPDGACNLRFVNRYCYMQHAALIMAEFINEYNYNFRRIFRLDLCTDFERFDTGDIPANIVKRIVNHSYAKIYQANRRIIGVDRWDGCIDNSLSWGRQGSMVVTRLYNKSLEQQQLGWKKPWIVQSWFECGLIDNPVTRTKKNSKGVDYSPEIWRLEFQINSSARQWLQIESDNGKFFVEHALETYDTREKIEFAISQLIPHYFRFKIWEKGKKKYDCKDKVLFIFDEESIQYKLMNTATQRVYNTHTDTILKHLEAINLQIGDGKVKQAMKQVIEYFQDTKMQDFTYNGISPKLLQLIMAIKPQEINFEEIKQIQQEIIWK